MINSVIGKLARTKFGSDVAWNFASFIILGITGIVINIVVGRYYGASTLGVFNQVFALYIFFSQFAVFGIHFSVLKHVAEHSAAPARCDAIISSGLAVSLLSSGLICLLAFLTSESLGRLLESPDVASGLLFILPGLFCFALNKVLLSVLNGFRHMKAFAFGQALRYLLMLFFLLGFVIGNVSGVTLPAIISGAEVILFLFLVLYTLKYYRPAGPGGWDGWLKKHLSFGAKSFLSGTMAELNTRVDILMLGYFLSDKAVGIYSIAALIVEGLAQVSVVLRNNLNPVITQLVAQSKKDELALTIRRGMRLFYAAMAVIGLTAIVTYPAFVRFLVASTDFKASWAPFVILMAGIMLSSGYLPFNMLLVQTGFPGLHTLFVGATILTNIALNALLIPYLGLHGAAYATAGSYILTVIYLKLFARKTLGISI